MKNGHKHKTGYFGFAGEHYCASLFQMARIDNGHSRPDLITIDKKFNPPLAIEIKSGRYNKSVINLGSLLYSVLPIGADGNSVNLTPEELKYIILKYDTDNSLRKNSTAVYFDALGREDDLTAKEISHPYSSIKFLWGNQYIVPARFTFFSFVVSSKNRKLGSSLEDELERIKQKLVDIQFEGWARAHRGSEDWQNMPLNDINYFLTRDESFLKKGNARKRVQEMRTIYPEVEDLTPLIWEGPNNTRIYILTEKEHLPLFNHLEKTVKKRNSVLTKLTKERRRAEELLLKTKISWQQGFESFFMNTYSAPHVYELSASYSSEDLAKLERLQKWLAKGERIKELILPKAVNIVQPFAKGQDLLLKMREPGEDEDQESHINGLSATNVPF